MKSHTILVVEDERIIARDIQMLLAGWGYHVPTIASTGSQAIALALEHPPDLIVMDIHLNSPIDGIMAAEVICARHPIPIVFLTANTQYSTRQSIDLNMPYSYLLKPFNEQRLQAMLQRALKQSGSNNQQTEHNRASS